MLRPYQRLLSDSHVSAGDDDLRSSGGYLRQSSSWRNGLADAPLGDDLHLWFCKWDFVRSRKIVFCGQQGRSHAGYFELCAHKTIYACARIDIPCRLTQSKICLKTQNNFEKICFQSIIAGAMVLYGTIDSLIDFFSFTAWIFYGGAMLALIVMRYTKPNYPRPYKVYFTYICGIYCFCYFILKYVCL